MSGSYAIPSRTAPPPSFHQSPSSFRKASRDRPAPCKTSTPACDRIVGCHEAARRAVAGRTASCLTSGSRRQFFPCQRIHRKTTLQFVIPYTVPLINHELRRFLPAATRTDFIRPRRPEALHVRGVDLLQQTTACFARRQPVRWPLFAAPGSECASAAQRAACASTPNIWGGAIAMRGDYDLLAPSALESKCGAEGLDCGAWRTGT